MRHKTGGNGDDAGGTDSAALAAAALAAVARATVRLGTCWRVPAAEERDLVAVLDRALLPTVPFELTCRSSSSVVVVGTTQHRHVPTHANNIT